MYRGATQDVTITTDMSFISCKKEFATTSAELEKLKKICENTALNKPEIEKAEREITLIEAESENYDRLEKLKSELKSTEKACTDTEQKSKKLIDNAQKTKKRH